MSCGKPIQKKMNGIALNASYKCSSRVHVIEMY